MEIETDRQRLQQVILNLQSNALKFPPADGRIDICCALLVEDRLLQVTVKDTGVGISPED